MGTRKVNKTQPVKKRKKPATKKTTKKTVEKLPKADFALFCEYMALPTVIRSDIFKHPKTKDGLESQRDFADAYEIQETRLSEWKRKDEYLDTVSKLRKQYFKGEIGDSIQALLTHSLLHPKGSDLKVLLEYANEVEKDDPTGEVSENLGKILGKLNKLIPG